MQDFFNSIPHKFNAKDKGLIEHALSFARRAHQGQKRKSGEDFVHHPMAAATILGQIFPDTATIVATILHDITEDTQTTLEDLTKEFGEEIAELVDGVTKLGQVRLLNSQDEYYVENLRKMFIATSKDVRVMLIKLSDRLHNMRTLEHLPPEKQQKIATETLGMYAPIAGRLGIGSWKDELEDMSFKIVDPENYTKTEQLLNDQLAKRAKSIKEMQKELYSILKLEGIKFEEITGRTKRIYSLAKKLERYDNDITKIRDLYALRVITKSTADCYAVLGIIHKHFNPVPGRVKDFIATPKPNGYQSIHTTVFDEDGEVFEVQVRTDLMHETAERGIAAHWFYAEKGKPENLERGQKWFQELRAWQEEMVAHPEEFLEGLKVDFFKDRIFILTPKGDVKDLPVGASVIDFAFAVHSDLGYQMMGAKVNGKIARLADELHQGDVVEILKSKKPATPSRDWLTVAKTSHARSMIRKYLQENDKGIFQRVREIKLQDISSRMPGLPTFFRKK
ncbi:bifunctional (p)ppGpp synthetase/guanosine-3',5'-bis(diphosphate) 3'-pyrophosphohydrolase [bacterium]|nr:MAG: bifunctional (p)ppGpp synthetase/guanosine-3',5'-bis(diphosphate) 3'-pyrophosphohydrolase [bacterium]